MIVQVTEIREGGSGDDISYIIIDTEALRQVEPYENDNGVILDFKFYADVLEKETSADEEIFGILACLKTSMLRISHLNMGFPNTSKSLAI